MEAVLAIGFAAVAFGFLVGRNGARMVPIAIGIVLTAIQIVWEGTGEGDGEVTWLYWPLVILSAALALSVAVMIGVALRQWLKPPSQAR